MFETLYRGILDICLVGVLKYCYVNLKVDRTKKQNQSTRFTLGSNDGGREDTLFMVVGIWGFGKGRRGRGKSMEWNG